jgi:anti-sigma factor RsiW
MTAFDTNPKLLLHAYLDGELDPAHTARLEAAMFAAAVSQDTVAPPLSRPGLS